jgi:solute carrier family 25 carnitine/acylcarnitine transporter 20/29
MGRQRSGEQGPSPSWLPIHSSIVPFVCGSFAGVRILSSRYAAKLMDMLGHILGTDLSIGRVSVTFLIPYIYIFTNLSSVKTKVQQRALAGEKYRTTWETLHRLIRGSMQSLVVFVSLWRFLGPDPDNPKPLVAGVARIYRGLGVSALRSITTHGLLWTLFDMTAHYVDSLPSFETR